jgi:phage-related protein
MKSPTRIFDPAFRYVPSFATDIRKTFKRALRSGRARRSAPQTVRPLRTEGPGVHQVQTEFAAALKS